MNVNSEDPLAGIALVLLLVVDAAATPNEKVGVAAGFGASVDTAGVPKDIAGLGVSAGFTSSFFWKSFGCNSLTGFGEPNEKLPVGSVVVAVAGFEILSVVTSDIRNVNI